VSPDPAEYYDFGDVQCWDVILKTAKDPVEAGRTMLLKYSMRLGRKPGNPPEEELTKIVNWALKLKAFLEDREGE
jgi:hypothetical protein